MAELIANSHNDPKGAKRKQHSTRVDLTPMVDLGFLLITFFIFTTSLSEPKAMKLMLPDDTAGVPPMKAAEEKTLNIIIGGHHKIWTYSGVGIEQISLATSISEMRERIQAKQSEVARLFGDARECIVLIKPTKDATYQDIVNALDEMTINAVSRRVLMEPTLEENLAVSAQLHDR